MTATGQNGDTKTATKKPLESKRRQVKMAKVKTATNPITSVTVYVDLNAISITIVVHFRKSQSIFSSIHG